MNFLKSSWVVILITVLVVTIITIKLLPRRKGQKPAFTESIFPGSTNSDIPDTNDIPNDFSGDLVRYGMQLISNTAFYLGPHGIVKPVSNGMNCQNCHLDAGLKPLANPFTMVASTYPRYRPRSGRVESIEFRVNDCMQRSLNGETLDSTSYEMRAIVAYIKWTGNKFDNDHPAPGTGAPEPSYLVRAADSVAGRQIYDTHCARCHGKDGQGTGLREGNGYQYPPLWGSGSFTMNAGMFRLSRLAGFIKNNMPFDSVKLGLHLQDAEAWDVSAFIASKPRPVKQYPADWPDISKKPFDHPFAPYADPFSETQHKFGPFDTIIKYQKKNNRR
jgi:thiosulfate dehydrogenase